MVTKDQTEFPSLPQEGAQPPQTISVRHLQRKLKDAAKKILSLSLEKEQLLEMGNRLRAERGHPKGRYLGKAGGPGHTGVMPMEREAGAVVLPREAKRKSFLACLPQAWGQREGCRQASQRPLVVDGSQPDASGTGQGFISALGVP